MKTFPKASGAKFKLSEDFVNAYRQKKVNFGFNGLGEIAYKRSYSRTKDDGASEEWPETAERVVNGCFNMQRRHLEEEGIPFNYEAAQREGQKMYAKIFDFKFLPPGRGLWAMGTRLTEEKSLYAALNNCAFVSTNIRDPEEFVTPFTFLMDLSMLGVGVGFDTKGAGKLSVHKPIPEPKNVVAIEDSREGWVNSVKLLLESYFLGRNEVVLDYSKIRPEGMLLKGFGGISSGPEPLRNLHTGIRQVLDKVLEKPIRSRTIVDLMNLIGKCIVSGNIRRTAEIAFGDADDDDFLNLKNYTMNPERESYGWTSNNSVFARLGMDYAKACHSVKFNGEPGFCWLENMKAYGRMGDPPNYKDYRAAGGNPCLEQTLESFEMCCLVETFPYNHVSYDEFEDTLKYAYLYSKTVTLGLSHWAKTNEVIRRNRRIGCSMSGIAQFLGKYSLHTLREWCRRGYDFLQNYDRQLSHYFNINCSIKTTCIKPSGTVSLLAGATPGVHFPESQYYIRRVRFSKNSDLYEPLLKAGYKVEPDVYQNDGHSMVVEIPVCVGSNVRTIKDVSMWEQLALAAFMQENWADNQVSCTVTFDSKTEGHAIPHALSYFQYKLKGISFLPRLAAGKSAYVQLPYEEITEKRYLELMKNLKQIAATVGRTTASDPKPENFCDGDKCLAHFGTQQS